MLPAAAVFHFVWEIGLDRAKDGASIRTFGRLTDYLPETSKAILTSHHASERYQVSIQTSFVEPFNPIIGAQYIVLGEIEKSDGEVIVQARVFTCVDGVDVALLRRAVNEQRTFFKERKGAASNVHFQENGEIQNSESICVSGQRNRSRDTIEEL